MEPHFADISRVIQLAVAPVFLLTAITTLISALNSRLARIIDRRRVVLRLVGSPGDAAGTYGLELHMLERRSRLVYFAIFFAVLSALLVCLVVAGAFVGALLETDLARTVATLFILCMLTMIVAFSLFLREIYLAVRTATYVNP